MSFSGDIRHTPAATKPPVAAAHSGANPISPLTNLSVVQARMDNLHQFLSDSVNARISLGQTEMEMVSNEIADAIKEIIVNGTALLSRTPPVCPIATVENRAETEQGSVNPDPNPEKGMCPKVEIHEIDDFEIVEMDAVELLAEHVHFCEICGKGFKRDANLRMHMRAHGFKTAEALAGPEKGRDSINGRKTRFSCPFVGCNRNKGHGKFRALKSEICVKNHFKRSHCAKVYSCNVCNKKSFSVLADLKSHLKHCGEVRWRCSCGTRFSRKDKLFGHVALFEGHMPAVVEEEEEKGRSSAAAAAAAAVVEEKGVGRESDEAFLEGFWDDFESIEDFCIQDELYVSNGMEGGFDF